MKQNIVVIHAGTKVSSFLGALIDSRKIRFKVIANTLLDFPVPGEKDQIGGWISKELISLATSIIKDDLTSSPLASLFSKSKSIEVIKLTPSEQFLASWFSDIRTDQKTAFEKTIQVFDTLTNYSSLPMKVFPLSYQQKQPINIKYRNQSGSPRTYQMFGYLDLKKKTQIDPADISASMKEEKDLDVDTLDEKESIVPAEIEKILKDADSVIISSDDFFSLAIMLSYTDLRKSIKKSQGSVLTIAPIGSRFKLDDKEKVLLEMFGIEPTIQGFLNVLKDLSDTLCFDTGDSDEVSLARESGFNVIVEDLFKIENKTDFLSLILKGAGVDVSNLLVDEKEGSSEKDIKKEESTKSKEQVQVKALPPDEGTKTDKKDSEDSPDNVASQNEIKTESKSETEVKESNSGSSKLEKSANVAKSVSKSIADDRTEEKEEESVIDSRTEKEQSEETSAVQQSNSEKVDNDETTEGTEEENNSRELFNNLMDQISDNQIENLDSWIIEAEKYIKKDESNSIQVANGLVTAIMQISKDKTRNNAINAFLILSENRKIEFRNSLLVWLSSHLGDPDFTIQNTQYDVIRKMILNDKYQDFIGELLESFIKQLLTSKEMTPSKQERGRLLTQRIAYNSRKLSKYAIRAFLDLFDHDAVSHNDIWPGLSSFDARLVGIEMVEGFSVMKSRSISEEAKRKELGSFSILLEDIVSSWEKGDMSRLTLLCGTISDSALRKAKRLSLAQNIKKVGTIPLEILARSLSEDPKELETLVYEMVMNDEIHAKLEIVDGRLYIIPLTLDEEQKIKNEKPDPIELKNRLNEMKEEVKEATEENKATNNGQSSETQKSEQKASESEKSSEN